MVKEVVVLHCTEGGSDKVYIAELQQEGEFFSVNYHYGRRIPGDGYQIAGGQRGTKTSVPIAEEPARAIFQGLVDEKTAKGYNIVERVLPDDPNVESSYEPIPVLKRKDNTGIRPMLLLPIETEEEARKLCDNPSFCMQEKFDGERRLLRSKNLRVEGINRKGEVVAIPQAIRSNAEAIFWSHYLIDGEEVGEHYYAFDLLERNEQDLREDSMESRMKTLSEASFLTDRVGDKRVFHVVRTAYWKEDKHKLFDEIKARNGEGVVFKMVGAPYQAGRSKFSKKYKFTATATCIVLNNGYSKRSVLLGVKSPDVKEVHRPIGNCTIPANFSIPNEGELVEVRYLYAYPNGGSLFQPVYLGPRTDKDEPDSYDSLKFKAGADPELDAIEEEVTA